MMRCTERGCLAELAWLRHSEDRPLRTLAESGGWKLLETGWRCPAHAPRMPANSTIERGE